jgi:plasmid stability protein
MADILIRKVDERTKTLLKRRAERRGKSLEADLREALEKLAREQTPAPDDLEPFGTWAVRITRPGVDLDDVLKLLRSAPARPAKFD